MVIKKKYFPLFIGSLTYTNTNDFTRDNNQSQLCLTTLENIFIKHGW